MNTHIRAFLIHAKVTTSEIMRGGSTIGLIVIWALLLCVGTAFGSVSMSDQILVIKDFGLFLSSLGTILVTVVSGAALLSKDIKQKHIYTILSKPISRFEYILAKWIGIWTAALLLNIIFHSFLVLYIYAVQGVLALNLFENVLYLGCETLILSAICLLVASIFVTPLLVGVISFFLFVAGRNLETISSIQQNLPPDSPALLPLRAITAVLPHLYYCNIANALTYNIVPNAWYGLQTTIYCFSYATACFILASLCLSKRNFN